MKFLLLLSFIFISCEQTKSIKEAEWIEQSYGAEASVRAIFALNDQTCWLAGSKGLFAYTHDGGETWQADTITVAGGDTVEFRDIHMFSEHHVLVQSIGPGTASRVYQTKDGGKNWTMVFQNTIPEAFFDVIEFWDDKRGIMMSDIVDGYLYIMTTEDAGETWTKVPTAQLPKALDNEGGFAASGTNMIVHGKGHVWIGTSASPSRVFYSSDYGKTWTVTNTPIQSEASSAGIFSIAFVDEYRGIAVGGNYSEKENTDRCIIITEDGGKNWRLPSNPNALPYRSCIRFVPGTDLAVVVGRTGSNYSNDFGETWTSFSDKTYYTLSFAPHSHVGWAAGPNGNLAKLKLTF